MDLNQIELNAVIVETSILYQQESPLNKNKQKSFLDELGSYSYLWA